MTMNTRNYGGLFSSLTLLCLAVSVFPWGATAKTSKAKLQELVSISPPDLPTSYGAPEIESFVVSPDNQTIIVAFKIAEQQHAASIMIGKWEIASKRLLVKVQLEEPTDWDTPFVNMLFTPDGQFLISQTYHAIYILDAKTLEINHTIQISSSSPVLSGDGHVLAVTERSKDQSSFVIFDVQSGEQLGRWRKPEDLKYLEDLSLSFHGDQMLLATPWRDPDILLGDSFTGKIICRFSSGYRREQGSPSYGVGSAVFIDSSRFVAAPSQDSGKTGRYAGKTLRIFNADTGELLQELGYRHLAPGHEPWASPSGSMLALINAWRSPSQNFADVDVGIPIQLLLFRLDATQPVCVVEDLPISEDMPEGAADPVRPSPDLSVIGFLENNQVTVYKVQNCDSFRGAGGPDVK